MGKAFTKFFERLVACTVQYVPSNNDGLFSHDSDQSCCFSGSIFFICLLCLYVFLAQEASRTLLISHFFRCRGRLHNFPSQHHDLNKMMPISSYMTPTFEKRCTATSPPPPPVQAKRQIRLPGNKDDDEGFESFARCFPSLVDESDMCDYNIPSAIFNNPMKEDEICLCTLTQTFNSPLSVENKFAIPRIRLKPRYSRTKYETNMIQSSRNTHEATESSDTQDLPPLTLFSQGRTLNYQPSAPVVYQARTAKSTRTQKLMPRNVLPRRGNSDYS